MQHAWQEQFHIAVAKGNIDSPRCGVEAGDAQRYGLLPPTVIVGTLPYVVRSKDIIWNYKRDESMTQIKV